MTLQCGKRIYRLVLIGSRRGCDIYDPQPLTIVRINRKSVTVDTDQGGRFRLPFADIQGEWIEEC